MTYTQDSDSCVKVLDKYKEVSQSYLSIAQRSNSQEETRLLLVPVLTTSALSQVTKIVTKTSDGLLDMNFACSDVTKQIPKRPHVFMQNFGPPQKAHR